MKYFFSNDSNFLKDFKGLLIDFRQYIFKDFILLLYLSLSSKEMCPGEVIGDIKFCTRVELDLQIKQFIIYKRERLEDPPKILG